jgi:DNA repair protein RecN (Recombination protein N)
MIERLRIEELALVEKLELEFGSGLNVLTGETGAGKSIVLGALSLLAGARAQADAVREGSDSALVEAVFDTSALPKLEAELAERGLEAEGHELIVRRSVSRNGRGRAWIGGQLVPISTLSELLSDRIEISSQHASQALLRPEAQGRLLDASGGLEAKRERVAEGVAELRERDQEIMRLQDDADERTRREDYLTFQIQEIDEGQIDPAELSGLDAEHRRLVHAERLQVEAGRAAAEIQGDASVPEAPGAADRTGGAARSMEELASLDPSLEPLAERLLAARTELDDVGAEIERYASAIEVDPARLVQVEERIQLFERLRRKYGETAEAILEFRDTAAAERAALAGSDERLGKLTSERAAAHDAVAKLAAQLSRGRKKTAKSLAAEAEAAIRELALAEAEFEIALEPVAPPDGLPCAAFGAEATEFRFTANPGEGARALRKVVSGGELSRIFLALKNVLRRTDAGMVLVFDEVDTGIGGAVADKVGGVLGSLASEHQVLCITHLPQIAAQGEHHFQVKKSSQSGRTRTELVRLSDKERVDELARMAGGETVTEATRRHARALLRGARASESDQDA